MNSVNTLTEGRPTRFGPQRLADLGTKLRGSLALLPLLVGVFLLFGAADATATVNLTIHNTGCEDMKVYKKDWGWETYQTTISAGSSWSCWTWYNQEFVFRKTNNSYISNYFCTISSNQSHNCDSGGCSGSGTCDNLLINYTGNCVDDGDKFNPSSIASCLTNVSQMVPSTSSSYASCSGNVLCFESNNTDYKFTFKATSTVELRKFTGNFYYPVNVQIGNGGSTNSSSCGATFNFAVKVKKNGVVLQTINSSVTKDVLTTKTLTLSTPITVNANETIEIVLDGLAASSSCQLFEFTGFAMYGCCGGSPCANQGGDTDGDGVCNNQDCAPTNASLPATPGTACNDGNANTTNDVIQADGCTCAGTVPNPCANQGGDTDGDGVCNNQDCAPTNASLPATPGTACNDGNANTTNDVIQADGCTCAGTPVQPVCDNITNGGTIGFGAACAASATVCNASPGVIGNCASPTGGTGSLEIIWLKATNNPNCVPPSTTVDNIANDPYWSLIPGATGLTYDPGVVTQQTCYLRCTRRAGCTVYLESNIISVGITPGCGGGGGTPDCNTGITVTTGAGSISINGLGGAPVSSVNVFNASWQQQYSCFANCGASQTVNVPAGTYFVYAKYYTAGYQLICEKQVTVTVTGGGNDPCASQGGDSDSDGTCNNNDCQPNNPAFPATPGTACNDNNANTTNDVVTADGCGCAGTPVTNGPNCDTGITITTGNGSVTVTGLGGAPISSLQVLNSAWQQQYSCFANCGASQTVNLPAGTYFVYAKYYTAGYQLICEKQATVTVTGGDPCASLGGDTDGDGVCNNNDCQPNNPAYPATPGTACNDNDANTTNDVVTADGCGCAGTPVSTGCTSTTLVSYSMQACNSCSGNSSSSTWTELTPSYSGNGGCTGLTATAISPKVAGTEHSCTPRSNGNALCTGSGSTLRFSVTLPNGGTLSGLSFFEQAPAQYTWSSTSNTNCSGTVTGANNPPTKFDLKVFKGSTQVFSQTYSTQSTWNQRSISFAGNTAFNGTVSATYTFEFTPHTTVGAGSVKAWDIDEIAVAGCCGNVDPCASSGGDTDGDGVCNNNDCQPSNPAYPATPGSACNDGNANTTNDVVQADGCTCAGTNGSNGGGSGGTWCKVGKRVWHDKNSNGIFDGTDNGIAGVWVNLRDHLGNSLAWKVTDSQGNFDFDNLQPGNYKLAFSTPGGFVPTTKHTGSDNTKDSDIDYWSGHTDVFSLISGQFLDHCDAGYKSGQYLMGESQDFSFDVDKQLDHTNIFWQHNGGDAVVAYVVERSADGQHFETISEFASRGSAANELYEDFDLAPLSGDNYYRLAIHRTDGHILYSEVKKLVFEAMLDFQLFPNPASSFLHINLEKVVGQQAEIHLYNGLGVRVKAFQVDEIYSRFYEMDIRDLKEGHYVVWINVDGFRPVAKTLVVGRM